MAISDWQDFDYEERAKSRPTTYLTEDMQPADVFAALIEPLQMLEEVFKILYDSLSIYAATGIMLDAFGEMISEPRLNRDDDTYRAAILSKRFQSGGSGTGNEVSTFLRGLTNATKVRISNHYPAAYVAIVNSPNMPTDAPQLLHQNTVAGVAAYLAFDYNMGGFELSGVGGASINVLGQRPGADIAIGLSDLAPVPAMPSGQPLIIPGTDPLTVDGSTPVAPGVHRVAINLGAPFVGIMHRPADTSTGYGSTISTAPAAAVATAAITGQTLTITPVAAGQTLLVILSGSGNDSIVVVIDVISNVALGVNAAVAAIGGTPLGSYQEFYIANPVDYGSRMRGAMFYGSYPDYIQ